MNDYPSGRICYISTLGQVRLDHAYGSRTRFATQKAAWLLAFLALRPGRRAPREHLLDLFWPDLDLPAGRNNLSTTLTALRRALEPPGVRRGTVLLATHADVGLRAEAVQSDVAEFERLLDTARRTPDPAGRAGMLGQAVALWGGDFLPGCYLDWAVLEGERLQPRREEALRGWAEALQSLGRWEDALEAARLWAASDPCGEEAHVCLTALLARTGRIAQAREVAAALERRLREEFGAGPSPETCRALAEAMKCAEPGRPPPRLRHPSPLGSGEGPVVMGSAAPHGAGQTGAGQTEAGQEAQNFGDRPLSTSEGGGVAKPGWGPPAPLDRFFGREAEMALLARRLLPPKGGPGGEGAARLVTLVGPGGVGKTRLAIEFTRQAGERMGAWVGFVPLADLRDPAQLLPHVAHVLRLPPSSTDTPLDRIAAFFSAQDGPSAPRALLMLDNLEQLLGLEPSAVAQAVQALLEQVPGLSLLCTSRQRLGLRGEVLAPVAPLPTPEVEDMPDSSQTLDLTALADYPSVRLYVDRAQAVRPDFALTPSNASAVAALCRRLDGSPLALELAASWVKFLPPRKMWERLSAEDGPGVGSLESRYDDLPERHRSLRAALDWSFRLLRPDQGTFFARLSAFRGGWTLEAARDVCCVPDALALLARLEEASLARVAEDDEGGARWHFLETVREYAAGRLREAGEEQETARRHRRWAVALAEQALAARQGPDAGAWLARLQSEHDNLRAALDRCASDPEAADESVQLAGALWWFWQSRGHLAEGRARLGAALARPFEPNTATEATQRRTRALRGAGLMAQDQGDLEDAWALHAESLALSEAGGDARGAASALNNLGNIAYIRGDMGATLDLYGRSLVQHRQSGNRAGEATVLGNLGGVLANAGDMDGAHGRYAESLALCRAIGDGEGVAWCLSALGALAYHRGDDVGAAEWAGEALAAYKALGARDGNVANVLMALALVALRGGRVDEAGERLADGLHLCRDLGARRLGAGYLEATARLALRQGQAQDAARLLGASETLRAQIGAPHEATERAGYEGRVAEVRAALGDPASDRAWAEGRLWDWDRAAGEALAVLEGFRTPSPVA